MKTPDDHPVEQLTAPSTEYESEDVVKIQLKALRNNNHPIENAGVKTVYNFATPETRATTGPVDRFEKMVSSNRYSALVNHKGARIIDEVLKESRSEYAVEVVSAKDEKFVYIFRNLHQNKGRWKDCWMTDSITKKL